jgi:hypothetical protein
MSTYVYASPSSEVRITVKADSEDQARQLLQQRILDLEYIFITVTVSEDQFRLVSAY